MLRQAKALRMQQARLNSICNQMRNSPLPTNTTESAMYTVLMPNNPEPYCLHINICCLVPYLSLVHTVHADTHFMHSTDTLRWS